MKKIILIIALILGFSITATAQKNKKIVKVETSVKKVILNTDQQLAQAKTDAEDVVKLLSLKDTDLYNFNQLFVMKYKVLNDVNSTETDKRSMLTTVDAKLRATLLPALMQTLEKDKSLFSRLVN